MLPPSRDGFPSLLFFQFVSCAQEKTREVKGAHKNQLLSLKRKEKAPLTGSFEGLLGTFKRYEKHRISLKKKMHKACKEKKLIMGL